MNGRFLMSVALAALALAPGLVNLSHGQVVVPTNVLASSNLTAPPDYNAVTFKEGAANLVVATGDNNPYGLKGFTGDVAVHNSAWWAFYPGHATYQGDETAYWGGDPGIYKGKGVWLTDAGDNTSAWLEFEFPEVKPLGQIWIWNFNDVEWYRGVSNVTIQTVSSDPGAGQIGSVTYDVTHVTTRVGTLETQVPDRTPDLIYEFPEGTQSRYLRLYNMNNLISSEPYLGLSEVIVLEPTEESDLLVPVNVSASSEYYSADTFKLGAEKFNAATADNKPYGLRGLSSTAAQPNNLGLDFYPGHANYSDATYWGGDPSLYKDLGLWMDNGGNDTNAWVEFELDGYHLLDQIWVWNFSDGPEIGRQVEHITIRTSSTDPGPAQLGSVAYNVSHGTFTLPYVNPNPQLRPPDLVFSFPGGTKSRYLKLDNMDSHGDSYQGLSEVLILRAVQQGTIVLLR